MIFLLHVVLKSISIIPSQEVIDKLLGFPLIEKGNCVV